jgi:hypothetical protein
MELAKCPTTLTTFTNIKLAKYPTTLTTPDWLEESYNLPEQEQYI